MNNQTEFSLNLQKWLLPTMKQTKSYRDLFDLAIQNLELAKRDEFMENFFSTSPENGKAERL